MPQYLYKVISVEDWNESQNQEVIKLPSIDKDFIHLAKEDLVEKVCAKFWQHVPYYVVLKVRTSQLIGRLVYETNPGGTSFYYHLYDGYIPLQAVETATVASPK